VVAPLVLATLLYATGAVRVRRRSRHGAALPTRAVACYAAGILALVVALISPLDTLGAHLFSAHMLQHVLLMLVAAPLLVLGRPLMVMMWALSPGARLTAASLVTGARFRRTWELVANPYVVWVIHAAAVWIWHAPVLYEATLRSEVVHALQHISFFGTALLFWWSALELGRRRARAGAGVLYIFTTALHGSILGALLTFSTVVWYPVYASSAPAWGLTILEDQQMGGLVMWIPAGAIYLVAALASLATLLQGERGAPALKVAPAAGAGVGAGRAADQG
jgi:putative membrane protein